MPVYPRQKKNNQQSSEVSQQFLLLLSLGLTPIRPCRNQTQVKSSKTTKHSVFMLRKYQDSSISFSSCLSSSLSLRIPMAFSIRPSVYSSVRPSLRPSVRPCVCLSTTCASFLKIYRKILRTDYTCLLLWYARQFHSTYNFVRNQCFDCLSHNPCIIKYNRCIKHKLVQSL